MKKIILPVHKTGVLDSLKGNYYVFLNREFIYFSSKRKASDFVRNLNSVTSDVIRGLVTIHKELYSIYLDNFFVLDDYYLIRIERNILPFTNRLTYFYKDYGEGWQSLKLNSVFALFDIIEDTILILKRTFKKLNSYLLINRLNSLSLLYDVLLGSLHDATRQKINISYKKKTLKIVFKSGKIQRA